MIKYSHLVLLSLDVLVISLLGNMLLQRSFRPRHEPSEKWFFTTLSTQRTSAWIELTATIILSTVCRLLVGFTLVSELRKLLKKVFPTFRQVLRFQNVTCQKHYYSRLSSHTEQPIFKISKSFEEKLQYALHFVDLFSHGENLLSVSQVSLNTHLSLLRHFCSSL